MYQEISMEIHLLIVVAIRQAKIGKRKLLRDGRRDVFQVFM